MYTKDAIRFSLTLAEQSVMRSMETIKDAPLTFPTGNGGCHPLWVLGHLAVVEGLTHQLLAGGENPVAQWGALFGPDTITTSDPSHYPLFQEVSARYAELRQKNLILLDSFSEADLDKPTPFQPKGLEEHFATYGRALLTLAVHQAMHRGQVTDAIRAAGRSGAVAVPASVAA
jgi:uncharacterized damage-inducible protein DinB